MDTNLLLSFLSIPLWPFWWECFGYTMYVYFVETFVNHVFFWSPCLAPDTKTGFEQVCAASVQQAKCKITSLNIEQICVLFLFFPETNAFRQTNTDTVYFRITTTDKQNEHELELLKLKTHENRIHRFQKKNIFPEYHFPKQSQHQQHHNCFMSLSCSPFGRFIMSNIFITSILPSLTLLMVYHVRDCSHVHQLHCLKHSTFSKKCIMSYHCQQFARYSPAPPPPESPPQQLSCWPRKIPTPCYSSWVVQTN